MTIEETNFPTIAKNVAYGCAFFATVLLVMTIFAPQVPEKRWAVIDGETLHASWDPATRTVHVSLEIQKRQECRRVIVDKNLRPIEENDVQSKVVRLEGALSEKIQKIPAGTSTKVEDDATPTATIEPGHYLLTLSALCELPLQSEGRAEINAVPLTPTTVTTVPVQVVMVVSSVDGSVARNRSETTARYGERE